jgi:hypothetical protein
MNGGIGRAAASRARPYSARIRIQRLAQLGTGASVPVWEPKAAG